MKEAYGTAGLLDNDGKFNAYLHQGAYLIIPPFVEVISLPDSFGEEQPYVIYPVPSTWIHPYPYTSAFPPPHLELGQNGWNRKSKNEGVLDDFIKLANAKSHEVKHFVEKWGPMWHCTEHLWCICQSSVQERHCSWSVEEPISLFTSRARQVQTVLDVVSSLKNGDIAAPEKISKLYYRFDLSKTENLHDPKVQWEKVERLIFQWLNVLPGGPTIELSRTSTEHQMIIRPGNGFLRHVWFQVAQAISGTGKLYTCSGCANAYIRRRKKPKRGNNNYCPDCAKNNLASKRDSKRRQRANVKK